MIRLNHFLFVIYFTYFSFCETYLIDSHFSNTDGSCRNFNQLQNGATPFFDLLYYDINCGIFSCANNDLYGVQRYWNIYFAYFSIRFWASIFHVIFNPTAQNVYEICSIEPVFKVILKQKMSLILNSFGSKFLAEYAENLLALMNT